MPERESLPEILLFDIGGVLVELGPHPLPAEHRIPIEGYIHSRTADRFEKGQIDTAAFARGIIEEFGLRADPDQLLEHFRVWPSAPFDGVLRLLDELRSCFGIAILSNTNELHWQRFDEEFGLLERCDRAFASHQIGLMKPDAEIFAYVCEALGTAPGNILFLDDNAVNVSAARAGGMLAEKVQGYDGILSALAAYGIAAGSGKVLAPVEESMQ
jgi:HAD superfamily hydrolase (TIGR01509 family)